MSLLSSDSPIYRTLRAHPENSSAIHPEFIRNSSANVFMEQLWPKSEVGKEERQQSSERLVLGISTMVLQVSTGS
jgi:hypothetical protein